MLSVSFHNGLCTGLVCMILAWFAHGVRMVVLWFEYGCSMVLVCICLVVVWLEYGVSKLVVLC